MHSILVKVILNRSGSITPLAAIILAMMIGFGSLAVDVGSFYYQRRILQGVADLAAMAAAETLSPLKSASDNLSSAQAAAALVVAANGYSPDTLKNVILGGYNSNASLLPTARFQASSTGTPNATQVILNTYTPIFLGSIFMSPSTGNSAASDPHAGSVLLGTSAIAASVRMASFQVGSRLLSFQGGIVNAVLGGVIGTNVSLTAMDYNSLIAARIDLIQFSSALASQIEFTGTTYSALYSTQVKLSDVLFAAASANQASAQSSATATNALLRLAGQAMQTTNKVDLSLLINFGPFQALPVDGTPLIGATVTAFDLLTASAQLANGNTIVSSNLGATIPGLALAKLTLAIGERPVGSPWVSIGPETAQVHTAQMRLLVQVTVGGPSPLPVVNLPIYIELAAATATLSKVACEPLSIMVGTQPALFNAWIGNVSPTAMANYSSIPNPGPAPILNVLGIGMISVLANATMTSTTPIPLSFSASDVQSAISHTASTTAFTGSLFTQLLGTAQLSIQGLPVIPAGTLNSLNQLLSGATVPIDGLLVGTLQTLGLSLGQADVWVTGVRCDGAVLVN